MIQMKTLAVSLVLGGCLLTVQQAPGGSLSDVVIAERVVSVDGVEWVKHGELILTDYSALTNYPAAQRPAVEIALDYMKTNRITEFAEYSYQSQSSSNQVVLIRASEFASVADAVAFRQLHYDPLSKGLFVKKTDDGVVVYDRQSSLQSTHAVFWSVYWIHSSQNGRFDDHVGLLNKCLKTKALQQAPGTRR